MHPTTQKCTIMLDNSKRSVYTSIKRTFDVWKKFSVAKNFPLSFGTKVDPMSQR